MRPRLSEQVSVRFDKVVFVKLSAAAAAENTTIAEQIRWIVEKHFSNESAELGVNTVETALRRVIEPHIDQLAGLVTNACISAGTSAWLAKAIINLLTQVDPDEAWEQAVGRAKVGLRRSMRDIKEASDEEY